MHLIEAIVDANRRRIAGDKNAGVPVSDFGTALPLAALTCIDVRLNHLLPEMLGLPEEQFIWLRNAGKTSQVFAKADEAIEALGKIGSLSMGEMKFPETKIGELVQTAHDWVHQAEQVAALIKNQPGQKPAAEAVAPPLLPKPRALPKPPGLPNKPNLVLRRPQR